MKGEQQMRLGWKTKNSQGGNIETHLTLTGLLKGVGKRLYDTKPGRATASLNPGIILWKGV